MVGPSIVTTDHLNLHWNNCNVALMKILACSYKFVISVYFWNSRVGMKDKLLLDKSLTKKEKRKECNLFNSMLYVPNSNLPRLRFFVYCIFITMWHSHFNDMEIHGATSFIPMGLNWVHHGVSWFGLLDKLLSKLTNCVRSIYVAYRSRGQLDSW